MASEHYIEQGGKRLRCGFTTGTCAAAASAAAVSVLLGGEMVEQVSVETPAGIVAVLEIKETKIDSGGASCAVLKDGGDDPDVTSGALIFARVAKSSVPGVIIDGGAGVGRVTKPGLDQSVGEAAINSVPRKMISQCVADVCKRHGYCEGIRVVISVPDGEEIVRRTFNPHMGIEGGISIIGTTGVVEPMSNRALIETIRLELRQHAALGERSILLTPGNYGESFITNVLKLGDKPCASCSNYIGDAIDAAIEYDFNSIVLIGHIGKLVKLGIGMLNTHSSNGDGRMETLIACALEAGADVELLRGISQCVATDAALSLMFDAGILEKSMKILSKRIGACLDRCTAQRATVGFICFTKTGAYAGVLAQSENAERLLEHA